MFACVGFVLFIVLSSIGAWRPWPQYFNQNATVVGLGEQINKADLQFGTSKKNEGSSPYMNMKHGMGPVLTSSMNVDTIWHGMLKMQQDDGAQ